MAHKKRRHNTKKDDHLQLRLFTTEEMSGTVDTAGISRTMGMEDISEALKKEDVSKTMGMENISGTVETEMDTKAEATPEPQTEQRSEPDPARLLQSMRSALMLISRMKSPQVRLIAMECATLAQDGVHPDRIYTLPALEGMSMDGHDFLALYYASFAQAFPSMIDRIHLPYSAIYAQAKEMSRHLNS